MTAEVVYAVSAGVAIVLLCAAFGLAGAYGGDHGSANRAIERLLALIPVASLIVLLGRAAMSGPSRFDLSQVQPGAVIATIGLSAALAASAAVIRRQSQKLLLSSKAEESEGRE